MAIQVGGTTVIDNSRNLQNVGGLKTVGGNSILGSGDIAVGGNTSTNTVGTYIIAHDTSTTTDHYAFASGRTTSGSNLKTTGIMAGQGTTHGITVTSTSYSAISGYSAANNNSGTSGWLQDNVSYSGSWRAMSPGGTVINGGQSTSNWRAKQATLWVRYA